MATITVLSKFELIPIDDLNDTEGNPQTHEIEELKKSIIQFGVAEPFIVNQDDKKIIGGHGRKRAILELIDDGYELPDRLVPVVLGNYTEEQARLLLLALNNIHGIFDPALLAKFVSDFEAQQLEAVGFDQQQLTDLQELLDEDIEWDLDNAMDELGNVKQKDYDESIADDVEIIKCPNCGHEMPK